MSALERVANSLNKDNLTVAGHYLVVGGIGVAIYNAGYVLPSLLVLGLCYAALKTSQTARRIVLGFLLKQEPIRRETGVAIIVTSDASEEWSKKKKETEKAEALYNAGLSAISATPSDQDKFLRENPLKSVESSASRTETGGRVKKGQGSKKQELINRLMKKKFVGGKEGATVLVSWSNSSIDARKQEILDEASRLNLSIPEYKEILEKLGLD